MISNHIVTNRLRRQQQAATNNAFAATFPIVESAVAPPNLPAPVPRLEGFAVPPAAGAATGATSVLPLPQEEELPAPQVQQPSFPPPPRGHGKPERMPRRQLTLREQYFPALLNLMRWKDGRAYTPDHQFTRDDLLAIHADHVYRHFKDRV